MTRVDPVHLFNERGHSILSADYLHDEIKRLTETLEEKDRVIRTLSTRLRALSDEPDTDLSFM